MNLKELTLIKQVHQKSACFFIIGTLEILNLSLSQIFLINDMVDVSFDYWKQKVLILGVFYRLLVKKKLLVF